MGARALRLLLAGVLDADYSDDHRRALEERPDEIDAAGYTDRRCWPAGREVVDLQELLRDFADEFGWVVVERATATRGPIRSPNRIPAREPPTTHPLRARWLQRPE